MSIKFRNWYDSWLSEQHIGESPLERPFLYAFEVYGFLFMIEKQCLYGDNGYGWNDFARKHYLRYDNQEVIDNFSTRNPRLRAREGAKGFPWEKGTEKYAQLPKEIAKHLFKEILTRSECPHLDNNCETSSKEKLALNRALKFCDKVELLWKTERETFRDVGGQTRTAPHWTILNRMRISDDVVPWQNFLGAYHQIKDNLESGDAQPQDEDAKNLTGQLWRYFIGLFEALYAEDDTFNSRYWCVAGVVDSQHVNNQYWDKFEKNHEDQLGSIPADTHADSLPDGNSNADFNFNAYVTDLASADYFGSLVYRSEEQSGKLDIRHFIERNIASNRKTLSLADLVDFSEVKVKVLSSGAGGGKTSSLIALIRSFHPNETELSERLGFEEDDSRKKQVPFFFSFNPSRGFPRATIEKGTFSEILENLMCGQTPLPPVNKRKNLLKSRGNGVFFVLDALDEANNLSAAIGAINSLREEFPSAGIIVTTRSLLKRLPFATDDANQFFLVELTDEQKMKLVKEHLIAANDDLNLSGDELSVCAGKLVRGEYTSAAISNPLFASIAARKLTYDTRRRRFKEIVPNEIFKTVVNVLSEKSAQVLYPRLEGVYNQRDTGDEPIRVLDPSTRAKKILRRLALVTFLGTKPASSKLSEIFGDIANETSRVDSTNLQWNRIRSLMSEIARDLSFPERNCDPDAWRDYLIASGIVSCSPSMDGGSFIFDSPNMQIYLAACGLSDLLADNRQSDCFGLLRHILSEKPDEEIKCLIVMLLCCMDSCDEEQSQAGPVDISTVVLGNSLEILNCVICALNESDETTCENNHERYQIYLKALKDVRDCNFDCPQLVKFQPEAAKEAPYLYRDLLENAIKWLEGKAESRVD